MEFNEKDWVKDFVRVGSSELNFEELTIMFSRIARFISSRLTHNEPNPLSDDFPRIIFVIQATSFDLINKRSHYTISVYIDDIEYRLSTFSGSVRDNPTVSILQNIFNDYINDTSSFFERYPPYYEKELIPELLEFFLDYTTISLEELF